MKDKKIPLLPLETKRAIYHHGQDLAVREAGVWPWLEKLDGLEVEFVKRVGDAAQIRVNNENHIVFFSELEVLDD